MLWLPGSVRTQASFLAHDRISGVHDCPTQCLEPSATQSILLKQQGRDAGGRVGSRKGISHVTSRAMPCLRMLFLFAGKLLLTLPEMAWLRSTRQPSHMSLGSSPHDRIHAPLPPASSGTTRTRHPRGLPGDICQVCCSSPIPATPLHPPQPSTPTTSARWASVTPVTGGLGLVCDLQFMLTSTPRGPSHQLEGCTPGIHALGFVGERLKGCECLQGPTWLAVVNRI